MIRIPLLALALSATPCLAATPITETNEFTQITTVKLGPVLDDSGAHTWTVVCNPDCGDPVLTATITDMSRVTFDAATLRGAVAIPFDKAPVQVADCRNARCSFYHSFGFDMDAATIAKASRDGEVEVMMTAGTYGRLLKFPVSEYAEVMAAVGEVRRGG